MKIKILAFLRTRFENLWAVLLIGLTLVSTYAFATDDDDILTMLPGILASVVNNIGSEFDQFADHVVITMDGDEVVYETNGFPNHTSAYWNPNNQSGLYVEPDPNITDVDAMSPGFIEDYNNLFVLRVPTEPTFADEPSEGALGPAGISVSGATIFRDTEGPGVALSLGVIQGFDRNGAHTGPQTYHYHIEPKAITNDDESLVGIIADGFFVYGRRCFETGEHPTDLDESGGHMSRTPYSKGQDEYHYHVLNESFLGLGQYFIVFPGPYQGTPNLFN